jgi:outer membrane lipoprotein-sorting protein
LIVVLPASGQGEDAAKLFRKMEQALTGAKNLRASAEVVMTTPKGDLKLVGSVHLAEGDRANLSFDSTIGEKHRKGTLVSDGKRMRWAVDQTPGPTQPAFPGLNRLLAAKFARAGVGFSFFLAVGQDTEETLKGGIETLYPASDFRLGATEKVARRDARAVEHKLTWASKGPVFRATVWVDVKTHLPLKRVLTSRKDGLTIRITEVYANITLDTKLDDKLFVLPK